jgi:hypothetical protein
VIRDEVTVDGADVVEVAGDAKRFGRRLAAAPARLVPLAEKNNSGNSGEA